MVTNFFIWFYLIGVIYFLVVFTKGIIDAMLGKLNDDEELREAVPQLHFAFEAVPIMKPIIMAIFAVMVVIFSFAWPVGIGYSIYKAYKEDAGSSHEDTNE